MRRRAMKMSDRIESFILELLKNEDNGEVEIKRNEMAELFGCAPSQINYVIATRFSPESGYTTESRRGGGGYIKIRRNPIGTEISVGIISPLDESSAEFMISRLAAEQLLNPQAAAVARAAVKAPISPEDRAEVMKGILKAI